MASPQDLNRIIRATLEESKAAALDAVPVVEEEVVEEEMSQEEFDAIMADLSEEEIADILESEQVELHELSPKLLTRYANKAQRKADKHGADFDKAEDEAMSTDGSTPKGAEKVKKAHAKANDAMGKQDKRTKGVLTAVSKLSPKAAKKVQSSGVWGMDADRKPGTAKVLAKEEAMTDEVTNVDEETAAASSLHPAARAIENPKSKVEAIASVLGAMHAMKKTDLLKWFNDAQSQFGPGKTYGVGDNSGKNSGTLDMHGSAAVATTGPKTKMGMPKLNVKEDMDALFEGQDLSEEFKENMTTLFEAAVNAAILAETAALEEAFEEAFEEALDEQVAEIEEVINEKLDAYLDSIVDNWLEENTVAIESTLRNELMEEFVDGLKNLFAEHYIEVPQQKVDVLEALAEKVEALESKLDESMTENAELKGYLLEAKKVEIFSALAEGLALTQQEKFKALAEGIEFDGDLDRFERKLAVIKEGYFAKKEITPTMIEEETFEGGDLTESTVHVDPVVNRYVNAITRNVKK